MYYFTVLTVNFVLLILHDRRVESVPTYTFTAVFISDTYGAYNFLHQRHLQSSRAARLRTLLHDVVIVWELDGRRPHCLVLHLQ